MGHHHDEKVEMNDETTEAYHQAGSSLMGLLVGAAIGVGAGLLLAPASGQNTRQKLRDQALGARDQALQAVEGVRAKAEEVQTAGREMLEENKRRIVRTAEAARQSAQEAWTSQGENGDAHRAQSDSGQVMLSHGNSVPSALGHASAEPANSGPARNGQSVQLSIGGPTGGSNANAPIA
jgi:gas vesicle protein